MDPKWRRVIAIGVVVGLILAGIGVYFDVQYNLSNQKCTLKSTNPIEVDQAEVAETADPDTAPSTPAWGLVQQVYQTLVMYNGSSLTNFTGVLAQNWSTSPDGFHWNFTLNPGIHFSNGDPFNAYVMWYSLYRLLALYGINQYLLSENFWFPNVNYYSNATQVKDSAANITYDLNNFDFSNPTAPEIAVMSAENQSFRVLAPNEIQLNLGFGYLQANYTAFTVPYSYLLAEIATPGAAAVDPIAIDQHGGVVEGSANSWMQDHAVGTGPYVMTSYSTTAGYTLTPDPNYWAKQLTASEPWNNNIQPAKATIQVNYQSQPSVTIQDLKSGAVATASFLYLGPSSIQELQGVKCLTVQQLDTSPANAPFSGANGAWWVFMNQSQYLADGSPNPFYNWSVRAAVAHAINYDQIIQDAFGGYAFDWTGPVPPGHPDYNPDNLPPYSYNLTLAKQEIADSPCAKNACIGMNFQYEYLSTSIDWQDVATIVAQDLSQIGITVTPVGITLAQFYTEQTIDPSTGKCTSAEVYEGTGPFYIGQDFYSSDYISPDDWTQEDFLSFGSANMCQSGFNSYASPYYNSTLDDLVYEAAGTSNPALASHLYAEMTQIMYYNYTNAWFACPYLFSVYNPALTGLYQTPMGSTPLSTMSWNTISA
jgi:peptide/nickel transport system substrate-binding protein